MPSAIVLPCRAPARVLACGAFLKNTACILDGNTGRMSALHGDLGDPAACVALQASVEALLAGAGGRVDAVAHDLHPDFHSTRVAHALAQRLGVPAVGVQHHHAHVAAVIAEHGLDVPVIGLALDGVGLGNDGTAWGGELLWVDGGTAARRWQRLHHLPVLALPGGDVAAREPWRMAAAALHALGHGDAIEPRYGPVVGPTAARLVHTMLQRRLNCPPTTAAGRWFDAAAGALGLSVRQAAEAEAAIALETLAARWLLDHPQADAGVPMPGDDGLDLRPLLGALFAIDTAEPAEVARGAAMFHLVLAQALANAAWSAARERGVRDIVLGGGCVANRVLASRLVAHLQRAGLAVHVGHAVPCGDAGLALGQAWVAACTIAGRAAVPRGSTLADAMTDGVPHGTADAAPVTPRLELEA